MREKLEQRVERFKDEIAKLDYERVQLQKRVEFITQRIEQLAGAINENEQCQRDWTTAEALSSAKGESGEKVNSIEFPDGEGPVLNIENAELIDLKEREGKDARTIRNNGNDGGLQVRS